MSGKLPSPEIDTLNKPYWDALAEGRLSYQACACGHAWLPPRAACPSCLGKAWSWQTASGGGRLRSWVIYHVAYHEAFKDKLPYNVAIVELDEGPRLITNILADPDDLKADTRVVFCTSPEEEVPLARFRLSS